MNEPRELAQTDPLDPFERQLARALRRVEPPEKLTLSLLQTAEAEARRGSSHTGPAGGATGRVWTIWTVLPKPGTWAGGAMAALLLLAALTGEQVHVRHQRQQAQLAQKQFETALRITDQALDQTRQQLARAGLIFQ